MAWKDNISICPLPNFRNFFQGQQGRVREVELGAHTIKSHGSMVARKHMHDWLILVLLVVIEVILNIIHPFYRFVGKDMMTDLRYPMKENTVPVWAVPMYAVLLPIVVFVLYYLRRRCVYDLHHSILGLLFAVLITGVLTDAIKDAVGRPRPDFFWRCFPDGVDKYDGFGDVICHGNDKDIKEGHKSFPSGHASWSFAVSRVDDYWHHWQDVFAGGLLGLVTATFCYLQFFPAPYHSEGWGPYAYFRAQEELRANSELTHPVNEINMQVVDIEGGSRQSGRNCHKFMPVSSVNQCSSPILGDMESGKQ